jgi:Putative zinc-finger
MDHNDATRSMASEKYLLNELSPAEAEEFEEHLFDCLQCATDIRAGSFFLEQSKVEFAVPAIVHKPLEVQKKEAHGWFGWWRPAFVIPAVAVLLLAMGYQNFATYRTLKAAVAENRSARILPAASLVSSVSRGSGLAPLTVQANQPFLLPLDVPMQAGASSYRIDFLDPEGKVDWARAVSTEEVKNTLPIEAPGVEKPGHYELVVTGLNAQGEKINEVRYPVELQFVER